MFFKRKVPSPPVGGIDTAVENKPGVMGANPYIAAFAPLEAVQRRGMETEDANAAPVDISGIPPYNSTVALSGFEGTFPGLQIWPVPSDVLEVLCSVPETPYQLQFSQQTVAVAFRSAGPFYVNFGGAARVPFTDNAGAFNAETGQPSIMSRSLYRPREVFAITQTRQVYVSSPARTFVQAWCWNRPPQ